MEWSPETLPDDPAMLKAMIIAQQAETARLQASVRAYETLIQALKIRIAKLQRQKFGPSSEKIQREIEQLELTLEDLEVAMAAASVSNDTDERDEDEAPSVEKPEPRRRGKPRVDATTPRERIVLDPGGHCPQCGEPLRLLGEDVSEILDYIAAKLKVVEIVRLKKSCRCCEKVVQTPAPTRPIYRGMFGPSLIAHILVSKFDDHLPLYRQGEIFSRLGADIPRSTLIDGCGAGIATLRPLSDLIKAEIFRTDRLHVDDTPIKVLDLSRKSADPMTKGVKEGRIWVYVRDARPWGGGDPPGVAYYFSANRKGEHPQSHLAGFSGVLQADAYGGFKKLYEPSLNGEARIREAACGRIFAAPFTMSGRRRVRRSPRTRSTRLAPSTISSARSRASQPSTVSAPDKRIADQGSRPFALGAKLSFPASQAKAIWPRQCATPSTVGRHSRSFSKMAASRSTTMRRSAPSGR
jgi:transposase